MSRITYTKELLTEAAQRSFSVMQVLDYLGLKKAGGTHTHISRKLKEYEVDTAHFLGQAHNRGKVSTTRRDASSILVVLPPGSRRPRRHLLLRAMLEKGVPYACVCGNTGEWRGKSLTLDIDHIDGDWLNNLLENLRFLCPNCHSQEETTNMPHKYKRS